MGGILFVHQSPLAQRSTFKTGGHGDWSAALPIALEKHGYLDVVTAGPEALQDPEIFDRHPAILVAGIPPEAWSPDVVRAARRARGGVLVEGPLPSLISSELGIRQTPLKEHDGAIQVVDAHTRELAEVRGVPVGGRLGTGTASLTDRDEALDWDKLDVPITQAQAHAWRRPSWATSRWGLDDAEGATVVAEWIRANKERFPAIVRRDGLIGCSFGMLAFLGQSHTVEPFVGREYRSWPRSENLEAVLIGLIDAMYERAVVPRVRMAPWPQGVDWVLNIRHDFDRALTSRRVGEILATHDRIGTSATWYWRARHLLADRRRHLKPRPRRLAPARAALLAEDAIPAATGVPRSDANVALRMVADHPRHEVAHHTEALWLDGGAEQQAIEGVARTKVFGTSAHGDPNCFRYQGAPNLLWAEKQGLTYTEMISHGHLRPHRFATLEADGQIRLTPLLCLPHHVSFERSTTPGDVHTEAVLKTLPQYQQGGGLMQLLNHPDINVDLLADAVREMPLDGRLDWTAYEACDWWQRTHVASEISFVWGERDKTLRIESARGVQGAVLEVRHPDGTQREFVLDLQPHEPVELRLRGDDPRGSWDDAVAPIFAEAVRSTYSGSASRSQATLATIRTNSELVPVRAQTLMEALGRRDLRRLRVLEAGCGFGALAAYLALTQWPQRLVGVDTRADYIQIAQGCAADAELSSRLEYHVADMSDLAAFEDGEFDLVIVNNALPYLREPGQIEAALTSFARVLGPGGRLLMHHANKWQLRDPFTRSPIIHLLPQRGANLVSRTTRLRHSGDRIRLVSPPELNRLLRRAGFTDVDVTATRRGRVVHGPWRAYSRFYSALARRPD